MQYQRFISYLYQYKDGEKIQNTGYVKVEQKGSKIRISLKSKVMEHNEPVYYAYLISEQGENGSNGFLLDKLMPSQGMLTYQYVTEFLSIDGFVGVLIRGEQAMYMTLWQDVELLPEHIMCMKESSSEQFRLDYAVNGMPLQSDAQALGINTSDQNVQTFQGEGGQRQTNFNETGGVAIEERQVEAESAAANEDWLMEKNAVVDERHMVPENAVNEEEMETGSATVNEKQMEAGDGTVNEEQMLAESAAVEEREVISKGSGQYRSGADYLFKNRDSLPAVEGSQLLDCIRIVPQDLGLLHMQNWRYGNNSFLSHGYYRYRYLLLGKLRFQDNSVKIILGVPSIYTNKEKYLANMFGFEQFVTARRTDRKLGQFGYWIVELTS